MFFKTSKTGIVRRDQAVRLKGVNLGGWLMMEGYILHAPNRAERVFKEEFQKALGRAALEDFETCFRENFIGETDFARISGWGFNCIRLPFNARLIETQPYHYDENGLGYLDCAVRWAKKYDLGVILDLHAACGAQNHDWHSDSLGPAELWDSKDCQDRTVALWECLAGRYQDETAVIGYDLLNEPVLDNTALLNAFYKRLITAIRRADPNHILFVEGNRWATDMDCLEDFEDGNLALSVHFYEPIDFTFNLVPLLSYASAGYDRGAILKRMEHYRRAAEKRGVPLFVGEFGVNARDGLYGEDHWLKDTLSVFDDMGFHWTYWTYKAVKNAALPDGLLSCRLNPAWINRQGPRTGWDTYARLWPEKKEEIIASWRSENFEENPALIKIVRG